MSGDGGLQAERTRLAWHRTLLSLAVGSLIAIRLLEPVLGVAAVGVGVAGLVAVAGLWSASARRARASSRALDDQPGVAPDGLMLLGVAVLVVAGGAAALLWSLDR